jgi:hypothetical protein
MKSNEVVTYFKVIFQTVLEEVLRITRSLSRVASIRAKFKPETS